MQRKPEQRSSELAEATFLDCRASDINEEMKVAASYALANIIDESELNADYILPHAFDPRVGKAVAEAVKDAAIKSGVARL